MSRRASIACVARLRSRVAGRSHARAILVVLTAVNFVNYVDRYVVAAVVEQIRDELLLDDPQAGLLGTVFMVVYTVVAPLSGYLGDRIARKWIVAACVATWSLATVGSGLAQDYPTLLAMRALVGVGEAGYATVAPSIIADLFQPKERGRKLALFYLAIPLGSAIGYIVGGAVGGPWGWRAAFMVAGAPGLALAIVTALLPEPRRGALDENDDVGERLSLLASWRRVLAVPAWRTATVGMTLMTFAMGGVAFWMPTFLQRPPHHVDVSLAGPIFGGITVAAGLLGTLLGGWLGDRAQAKSEGGYFKVSGWGLLLGASPAAAMALAPNLVLVYACAFAAEFLLFLNTGPLNAVLVACVPAGLRATAMSLNVFFIHALGDAISPYILGEISERSDLGTAIALTAIPIALAGTVLVIGARRIERRSGGIAHVDP